MARGVAERSKPAPNQWVLNLARDARDCLVEHYQPIVVYMARRFSRRFSHFQLMDLIQEGNIGLLKALDAFATVEGYSFASYASCIVHHTISGVLTRQESPYGVGAPTRNLFSKLRRFTSHFLNENGYEPDQEEIAEGFGITSAQAADLMRGCKIQKASSLQQAMTSEDGKEGREDFCSLYTQAVEQEDERHKRLRVILDRAMDASLTPIKKRRCVSVLGCLKIVLV